MLGDHGVRKYEYETGRFISIDPLWASYFGWTPYQYSRNNPIFAFDVSGGADFILNDGLRLSDGNDDGLLYATSEYSLLASIDGTIRGIPIINYEDLKVMSYLLPDKKTMAKILRHHPGRQIGEGGGVGGYDEYYYGGENIEMDPPNSTEEVKFATLLAKNDNYLLNITYYVHDHPNSNGEGFINRSIIPSKDSDRLYIHKLYSDGAKNVRFGILFNLDKVNIFGFDESQDIIIDKNILKEYANED